MFSAPFGHAEPARGNGQVDDAIAAATAHVELKKEEYKQTLLTLVDDNGQPVYTDAAAETLAAAMPEKTQALTAELDQARTDLNTLLNTIYASKTDPTQEQLENINTLLEQIGVLEVKLGTLQDQAVQVATAKTGRVKRGEGTDEDFGVAIGFTGEIFRQQTAEIKADADARLAALQAVADADGATQETIDAAYAQMDDVYGETAWHIRLLRNRITTKCSPCITVWQNNILTLPERSPISPTCPTR